MDLLALSNNMSNMLIEKLIIIPGLLLFFSFRGFFQAWVARKLGDETPANMGFLTMNPMAHIDPIGFICMLLVGIGFGKPIQFSSRNYKNVKRDGAIQILSAPAAGLILGFILYFLYALMYFIGAKTNMLDNQTYYIFLLILMVAFDISITLTVFLFLPLPGFDCYRLVANFLPYKHYRKLYNVEKYSLFIFLGFILILQLPGIGDTIYHYLIGAPSYYISNILSAPWRWMMNLML
ncbi:MAG: site-2 protease family protein [Clostridia bacterium]|nr:site-2 protease family protein [Clostridia bacterium]